MVTRSYRRGIEFPHEGFVQAAIEKHFLSLGFILNVGTNVDLLCTHPDTGVSWHIEAKGVTENIRVDFLTGLGQLLQAMNVRTSKHGLALPDTPRFRNQVSKFSPWVVQHLALHWLFVGPNGEVEVVAPT